MDFFTRFSHEPCFFSHGFSPALVGRLNGEKAASQISCFLGAGGWGEGRAPLFNVHAPRGGTGRMDNTSFNGKTMFGGRWLLFDALDPLCKNTHQTYSQSMWGDVNPIETRRVQVLVGIHTPGCLTPKVIVLS